MEQLMKNPDFKKEYSERIQRFNLEYKKLIQNQHSNFLNKGINATKIIPVAVHFPSVPNTSDSATKNCLRQLAQSQIDVINADYNATNTEISSTWSSASSFYPGVTLGDLDVLFYIANQNHPTGTGLNNGDLAVTFGTDFLMVQILTQHGVDI